MKYTLKFYKDDMGHFTQPGLEKTLMESIQEQALWFVNNAREHDGLHPLRSLLQGKVSFIPEEEN